MAQVQIGPVMERESAEVTMTAGSTAAGDVAAFATLTERHYPAVLRYLTRQTGDPHLAADLVQETFVAAFRHMDQLRDDLSFPAWIFQIARNQFRAELRRRRLRSAISLDWLFERPGEIDAALSLADQSTDVARRDDIQRALDRLPPAPREALLLHALGGFTGLEVSRILGISHEAARKRINRAEADFRDHYRALTGDEHVLPTV